MSRVVVARNEGSLVTMVAPLAGCAVGTAAIAFAADRFDIEKEKIAVAAIAIGVTMASQTTGVPRHIAMGLASAGIAMGVAEVFRHWKEKLAPPDAPVTHADLHKAMAGAETRRLHDAQTIASLRDEIAQLKAELAKHGQKAAPKRDAAPAKKPSTFMPMVTGEQGKKIDAILRQFDEHDRAKLMGIYESLPKSTVDQMFHILDSMPVHEAVNFVRNNVLLKS